MSGQGPPSSDSPGAGAGPGGRILVIKLGALGDFIQALGPMRAIRRHHPDARIALLTTAPFAELARASGYFDEMWIDSRPGISNVRGWLPLRRWLRRGKFGRVYDLQTSDRSGLYFLLMAGPLAAMGLPWGRRRPEWSGIARGCSHPHDNPGRDFMHTVERQAEQLARAGIDEVPPADVSFLDADVARFALAPPYVLLVPGGARHRPAKRWPAARYGALAARLEASGITPALLGAADEAPITAEIRELCPAARDLAGRTTFGDIAALARGAAGAVGNDTGPMHIIAAAGCPAVALFSADSDPALCAPRGAGVTVLRREPLAALTVDQVAAALEPVGGPPPGA